MEEKTDFEKQMQEICNQEPLTVTFKGKERKIHFFQSDTVARYEAELEKASESDTIKDRHLREVRLLAIVLADLHGSRPYLRSLKRWIWEKRLSYSRYDEVEAMQLLEAAVQRFQQWKVFELHFALIKKELEAIEELRKEILEYVDQKQKTWKGE